MITPEAIDALYPSAKPSTAAAEPDEPVTSERAKTLYPAAKDAARMPSTAEVAIKIQQDIGLLPKPPATPAAKPAAAAKPEVVPPGEAKVQPPRTMDDVAEQLYPQPVKGFEDIQFNTPPPSDPVSYAKAMSLPAEYVFEDTAEVETVQRQLLDAGIGIPAAEAAFQMYVAAATHTPVTITQEAAIAELKAEWGDKYDTKIAAVNRLVGECPAIIPYLDRYRLGDDPRMLRLLAAASERRQKGRK